MPDATTKKLIALIQSAETPELRLAALRVAGAVGTAKDAGLVQALTAVLDEADPAARAAAIEALGRLRAERALPRLLEIARQGGPDVEAAARAAGQMGVRGTKAVAKLLDEAHPFFRRRIAAALAAGGTESAAIAAAHALLDDDPGVVDAAARSLAAELPTAPPARRKTLAQYLITTLQQKRKTPLPAVSEAAILRLLAALHDPRAEDLLWARLDPAKPVIVQATALHALAGLPPPTQEARLQRLIACAAHPDYQVAGPALMLLQNAPVSAKTLKHWQQLLAAPDVTVRKFAVEKLRHLDSPAVASLLVEQLHHPDRTLREAAIAALGQSKAGRQALLDALLDAATPDEAWTLARAQAPHAKELPAAQRAKLFQRACRYHEADDRRADALWFLLRQIDRAWTYEQLEARALALRNKRDYAGAVSYFKLLTRDPAVGEDIRFELAATGLKTSNHDLAPDQRANDPSLAQFARLLQNPAFDVLGRLAKAKYLDANDLFYLGFHFSERTHREQEFGGAVLQLLINRAPRSALAKDARRKLQREGLS